MPQLIATWNPARSVWETNQTALCGHSALFSETWPAWGMTRDGQAFALPTLVPPTDDSACSSLPTPTTDDSFGSRGANGFDRHFLPTPTASMATGAGTEGRDGGPNLQAAVALLPTPAVNDMGAGKTVDAWDEWTAKMQAKHGNGNGHGKSLAIEAARLTSDPTPPPSDGGNEC
jgi:hypothetical protein